MDSVPFDAAVLQLLNDERLAAEFALRGPPYAKSRRTYDILGNNVSKIYNTILMESQSHAGADPFAHRFADMPGADVRRERVAALPRGPDGKSGSLVIEPASVRAGGKS